jgi:ubiquinone/menaquinone biosynthesis C-methylase UbiE
MNSIYENDIEVRQLTREAIAATNSRLLQIHRFSAWDDLHAKILLEIFNPKPHAKIADVGCGVGELAELMSIQRPDLQFTLINRSSAQLNMCPPGFKTVKCMAEHMPFGDDELDVVMCAYVLGHLAIQEFLSECDRVLDSEGRICIYDIFKDGDPTRYGFDLGYEEYDQDEMIAYFEAYGFKFSHSRTTKFALPKVALLMPHEDTLKNTISAAMVFKRQ